MNYTEMTYCDCPQCNAADEPEMSCEAVERLRAEIVRSVDFISEIAPNESESLGIASAIRTGDDSHWPHHPRGARAGAR